MVVKNSKHTMKKTNILREIFSGVNGKLSAKRVIGGLAMFVALACTTVLVFRDGSNTVVENLLMTIFITSVSLLGLPAITGIWGSSKVTVGKHEEETTITTNQDGSETTTEITTSGSTETSSNPNCDNCEYKKRHIHRR